MRRPRLQELPLLPICQLIEKIRMVDGVKIGLEVADQPFPVFVGNGESFASI